jgi:pilus assembly protein CpaB
MQRERNILFMILALLFAFIATGGIYYYLQNYQDKIIQESGVTESIIATNIELKAGTEIKEFMLTTIEWPKTKLIPQHITKKADVIGKVVMTRIPQGMPLLKGFIIDKGDNVSFLVPENMRAMTIAFGKEGSDARFVRPGIFVDVLATFKNRGVNPFTKTILQNVKIIAVNGKAEDDFELKAGDPISEVTILVKAQDTEKLALAKSQATLQIVIRNINDNEEVEKKGIDAESIMYGTKTEETIDTDNENKFLGFQTPLPIQKKGITVIRGTEVQEVRL